MNLKGKLFQFSSVVVMLGGYVVLSWSVPRPRSGPHSWRGAGRPLPHGKAVFEDPGCTPRVATTVVLSTVWWNNPSL